MPKSPEGKARSRMNAMKHGLRATDQIFLQHLNNRERSVFHRMRNALLGRYNPQTEPECDLVDQLAIQHFRLFRLYDLENKAFCGDHGAPMTNLDRFARYDWRIDRRIRTLHNRLCSLYCQRRDYSLTSIGKSA